MNISEHAGPPVPGPKQVGGELNLWVTCCDRGVGQGNDSGSQGPWDGKTCCRDRKWAPSA